MPTDSPSTSRFQPYVLMALVALAVRLAVIPFVYHEWMDPFVLEHWAFGRIARSIASGHGFGSPFADTGLSALLPPLSSEIKMLSAAPLFGVPNAKNIWNVKRNAPGAKAISKMHIAASALPGTC